ncbi:alanine--tRNA ligase, partial [Helicobacter sp. UBA3407]
DKDNFWQMGDVGPCGPCSEIFVDQGAEFFNGPEDYFGGDGDRFLEIWNLVFMQFERDKEGNLKPLPKPSIDTGMGLERVVALLEGKHSNFDSSLFMPLIAKVEEITRQTYIYESGASFRVIADHARSVAFLLAQGVNFDKEGRGYVLRRILRRAIRHGYLLGLREPFVYQVVGCVCENMGAHYRYLLEKQQAVMQQCKAEELRFFETIENGMNLFNKELEKLKDEKPNQLFSGEVAFKLYDTYGFPLDLTQDMLRENGFGVDVDSFEICMKAQKEQAKANWKGSGDSVKEGDFKLLLSEFGVNEFVGYEKTEAQSRILALLDANLQRVESIKKDEMGFILLDRTPFYPESGGPVGDKGVLMHNNDKIAEILDTKKYFGLNISQVKAVQDLRLKEGVLAIVDSIRLEIAKHHSATHLLHKALREILGEHITQAGSLVESNRLRFDFSHSQSLNKEELEKIEQNVNAQILSSYPQICEQMDIQSAKAKGAMALFGEKYGTEVRVISFGDSIELCGGIHVPNTAFIGSFYIVKESGVSSGVRRIEAVCGKAAYELGKNALDDIEKAKENLKAQNLLQGIDKLKEQVRELKNKANKFPNSLKAMKSEIINGTKLIVLELKEIEASEAKKLVDNAKNENEKVAILLLSTEEQKDKIGITAGVKGVDLKAGAWVKEIAQILGGNGGGREDFATAGGKDKLKIPQALQRAKEIAKEALK